MPKRRANAAELARLFDSAGRELYILDADLTIVYLNRACREWLGSLCEGLSGVRCAYHSDPEKTGPEAVAAGLCPPPMVLSGETCTAPVHRVDLTGGAEKIASRLCRFIPIGDGEEEIIAVAAILEPEGRSVADAVRPAVDDSAESGAIALHEQIRRFRNEIAARCRADRLIGGGPAMQLALSQVKLASGSRASVLLVGPPGSGRQRLASAVHYGGANTQTDAAPVFAALDCSLLGVDLLEAAASAAALAEARETNAGADTLLLHRIDELADDVQVELRDFLSRRLSGWRLAATAAEPLVELSRRGKFHAELAALLSTIVVELPPLSQRREDVPLLAQMFLEECNALGERQIGGFSPAALDRLDAYPWPGNLDELAAVVAESHHRASGREIGPGDLPERLRLAAQAAARPHRTDETIVLDEFLAHVERELIRRALARAKGNKARAARLLGVTRPRLYRRMVQLGLE
ncbi:MAG: sigma-54-dependent Fis family transcriptional regulator [Pirellulaceae bacterium]|nr:sigma-54-dependent Fis family transcriptional regulator [Pirellulaceae bacterium]